MTKYARVGDEIYKIKEWSDGSHATLFPVAAGRVLVLREGEFFRYTDEQNKMLDTMISEKL